MLRRDMLAKNSDLDREDFACDSRRCKARLEALLASFREMWEGGSATLYVGDRRANELMPFRLAVWRKLGCFKMTRSRWLF
jgi:hypothetical protein